MHPFPRIVVIGGGAAGFFGAIACAEALPGVPLAILERSGGCLAKVRVSGGGRCNVTHRCFDPREFSTRYPRGQRALIGAFKRFQAQDTVSWFEGRGVQLKTEPDGRMFPESNTSETIVQCLQNAAREAGVQVVTNTGVHRMSRELDGKIKLELSTGLDIRAERVLLAIGGCKSSEIPRLLEPLGHAIESPVPSLFSFNVPVPWLRELSGISLQNAEVSTEGLAERLSQNGPFLITHWGVSGPAILKLSAWGARMIHDVEYRFRIRINWLPDLGFQGVKQWMDQCRTESAARGLDRVSPPGLPGRLWVALLKQEGLDPAKRWAALSRSEAHRLAERLVGTELPVEGKTMNKEEFVTCGGIRLGDVDFKTMQSRICPGLYFAGEVLDIDGITGGFNFQAAWTTGWLAGQAMAASMRTEVIQTEG